MSKDTAARAMDALRDEMAKAHDNPGIAALGEYMTARLTADGSLAPMILAKGKSLAGALEAIRAYARKIAVKNVAVVDDQKGFANACEYYGIAKETGEKAKDTGEKEKTDTQSLAPADDPLSLDVLLGANL